MSALGILDVKVRARILAEEKTIASANAAYEAAAISASLNLIPRLRHLAAVTNGEMKSLYKDGMVKSDAPTRPLYDKIRKLSPHNKCPLCSQNSVFTIDHHLPKSKFCCFVVTPINLVPACRDCNSAKLAASPSNPSEQTIHPYFDDFTGEQWLFASINQFSPISINYKVINPSQWSAVVEGRLNRHMKVFKLNLMFSNNAADELQNIKHRIEDLFQTGGALSVREFLLEMEGLHKFRYKNNWQRAMYQALASSTWFCDGGFSLI